MKVGHIAQLLLVVSLGSVGWGGGMSWGRGGNDTYKAFLLFFFFFCLCSLNSKGVYSGFGDQLSAMFNLAN